MMTVTPAADNPSMGAVGAWNPWRALRARPHLRLVWARIDCGGLLEDDGNERRVVIDYRLQRRDRNAVLAHELVHDERDILFASDAPAGLVGHEEEQVRRETAARLVPSTLLARFVERTVEIGEPVHVAAVMEEFDVPVDVAQRALFLLEQRKQR